MTPEWFERRIRKMLGYEPIKTKGKLQTMHGFSPVNTEIARRFYDHLKADFTDRPYSTTTIHGYLREMSMFDRHIGGRSFNEATGEDFDSYIAKFEGASARTRKIVLRVFLEWLPNENILTHLKQKKVENGRRGGVMFNAPVLDKDIITPAQFQKLLDSCQTLMERAFLHVLKDSGARIQEISSHRDGSPIQLEDLKVYEKEGYARLNVEGKTGWRGIDLCASVSDLCAYLAQHPDRENADAPLWARYNQSANGGRGGVEPYKERGLSNLVRRVSKQALGKAVGPHMFRHTDASEKAQILTSTEMEARYGWSRGSRMISRYTHGQEQIIRDKILVHSGKKPLPPKIAPQPIKTIGKAVRGSRSDLRQVVMEIVQEMREGHYKPSSEEDLLNAEIDMNPLAAHDYYPEDRAKEIIDAKTKIAALEGELERLKASMKYDAQ